MVNHKQGDMPCAPIPRDQPYDVDCSWIKNRLEHVGGTGLGDGVGASEGEQYLAAFAYGLTLLISGEMAGGGNDDRATARGRRHHAWGVSLRLHH
eukprot:COSAG01_NODE_16042_length_1275_cov_1.243197_1_plen_94_part_10